MRGDRDVAVAPAHDQGARRGQRAGDSFALDHGSGSLVFRTQPGVFSHGAPDEGTRLLLETAMPQVKPHATVLDLGAGIGIIGISVARILERGEVWMVDSDIRAVRLIEENVRANHISNAHVVLGDITRDLPPRLRFDLVLSNPPTHSGKQVLSGFVEESHAVLRPGGWLYLVVNRLLSVRDCVDQVFGGAELLERRKGFIVFRAQKQRRQAGPREAPE